MQVMRSSYDVITTIVEVLLYDPLHDWALTPSKALLKQVSFHLELLFAPTRVSQRLLPCISAASSRLEWKCELNQHAFQFGPRRLYAENRWARVGLLTFNRLPRVLLSFYCFSFIWKLCSRLCLKFTPNFETDGSGKFSRLRTKADGAECEAEIIMEELLYLLLCCSHSYWLCLFTETKKVYLNVFCGKFYLRM